MLLIRMLKEVKERKMEEFIPLLTQLGFGGLMGFIIGFTLKKISKMLLILTGLYFMTLQYLAFKNFITIHYDRFSEILQKLPEAVRGEIMVPTFIIENIPYIGSFTVGFGYGFKKG